MSWIGDKTEKFRQVPNPYFSMHITGKFLFGGGLGVRNFTSQHYSSGSGRDGTGVT